MISSLVMDATAFQVCIDEAIASLPPQIRMYLDDVVIRVEPRSGRRGRGRLLGLYEGVPLTTWGRDFSGKLPDTITLFQETIEEEATSPEEVPHIIKETVWHEVAHHFGLDHDKIGPMEERWRATRKKTET